MNDETMADGKPVAKPTTLAYLSTCEVNPKAYPLADQESTKKVYDLLQQAIYHQQIKIGANEVTKALNKGKADVVVLAADAQPLDIILHLPLICEEKNARYIFVRSKVALGRACGTSRQVIAAVLLMNEHSPLNNQVENHEGT